MLAYIRHMSNHKNDNVDRFSDAFRALSNPNRLQIFLRLVPCCKPGTTCGTLDGVRACVGDLSRDLQIAASTVSHHLKELRQAGLIRMERTGKTVSCWVDKDVLKELSGFFAEACKD